MKMLDSETYDILLRDVMTSDLPIFFNYENEQEEQTQALIPVEQETIIFGGMPILMHGVYYGEQAIRVSVL